MRIFFTASFEGKKYYQKYYDKIIQIIESTGAQIISPERTRQYQDAFRKENIKKFGDRDRIHYEFIRQGIANADAVIIEASNEDFRIGHEATLAIIYKKPILVLSLNKDYGKLVRHEEFNGVKYNEHNVKKIVLGFLSKVSKKVLGRRRKTLEISDKHISIKKKISKNIAVLGSIDIDMVTKVDRYPKSDQAVISEGLKIVLGGKATNTAIGLSRLNRKVFMVGKVGNDFFGEEAKTILKREGVNTDFVDIDSLIPTGTIMITVEKHGKATMVVNEDANLRINKATIIDFLDKVDKKQMSIDCFYITLEPDPKIIEFAVHEFRKRKIMIFCDAAPAARPLDERLYKYIDFLSANEQETEAMTRIKVNNVNSAKTAAKYLQKKGANNVIITLGKLGAILLDKNKQFRYFPGNKVRVVDETAAGDAFRAAFVSEYLETKDLNKSMKFANMAGAYAVTKLGAYESIPTPEELEFLEILK